jgi:hypothetical protein
VAGALALAPITIGVLMGLLWGGCQQLAGGDGNGDGDGNEPVVGFDFAGLSLPPALSAHVPRASATSALDALRAKLGDRHIVSASPGGVSFTVAADGSAVGGADAATGGTANLHLAGGSDHATAGSERSALTAVLSGLCGTGLAPGRTLAARAWSGVTAAVRGLWGSAPAGDTEPARGGAQAVAGFPVPLPLVLLSLAGVRVVVEGGWASVAAAAASLVGATPAGAAGGPATPSDSALLAADNPLAALLGGVAGAAAPPGGGSLLSTAMTWGPRLWAAAGFARRVSADVAVTVACLVLTGWAIEVARAAGI